LSILMILVMVLAELVNLILLCTLHSIIECIIKTTALRVIAGTSDMYMDTMSGFVLEKVSKPGHAPEITRKGIKFSERSILNKVMRVIYRAVRIFYSSFYFYYMPYLVIVFTYVLGSYDDPNIQK
jgi:hypothetical protein